MVRFGGGGMEMVTGDWCRLSSCQYQIFYTIRLRVSGRGCRDTGPLCRESARGTFFHMRQFSIYKTIPRRNKLSAEEGDRLAQLVPSKRKGKKLVLKDI